VAERLCAAAAAAVAGGAGALSAQLADRAAASSNFRQDLSRSPALAD
jgi:hypothetical protein